jgi:hypothetical protein
MALLPKNVPLPNIRLCLKLLLLLLLLLDLGSNRGLRHMPPSLSLLLLL